MKNTSLRVALGLSLSAALLGGCAWASRNVYREPEGGDSGAITLLLQAPGYRSNVWISYNPTVEGDPKAISVFDDTPAKTVRALHKDSVVLSVQIAKAGSTGIGFSSTQCGKAYQVPFATGDLRVTLASTETGCAFKFERQNSAQAWEVIEQVQEWKPQRVVK
jgi:catalase (peroxidase I)